MSSVVKPWHCNGARPGGEGGGTTQQSHEVFFFCWKSLGSRGHVSDKVLLMQIKYLALPFAITCYLAKRIFYYNTAYFLQKFLKLAMYISFQFNPRCLYTKKRCKLYPWILTLLLTFRFGGFKYLFLVLQYCDTYFWRFFVYNVIQD